MKRPLIVVYNLFKESVLDLSWSRDKHILLACSTDGTVAVLTFTEDELGSFLSQEEKVCSGHFLLCFWSSKTSFSFYFCIRICCISAHTAKVRMSI